MAKIEGFRIKNYRTLKDVTLGRLWNSQNQLPLTAMTAVIGKNGVGKSTLFDAFGFLADCLKVGVEEACHLKGRGGFDRLRSQGQTGNIEFEIYYKEAGNARPITYELAIGQSEGGRLYVAKEQLSQRRKGQKHGRPFSFLYLEDGKGWAWTGEESYATDNSETIIFDWSPGGNIHTKQEDPSSIPIELNDARSLGIVTLGNLREHPRISAFLKFVGGWYLSYFTPDAARSLPLAGPQKHLNLHGDNLGNVVQFMAREHKERFGRILSRIAAKIPGIDRIDTEKTPDGRLLLRFNDKGFKDPFYAQQVSDGTLKIFAYLLLLNDPTPPPFLCIEEPENGLYHKLLETLAAEFREHATGKQGGSQVFITTHHPYFVNALNPDEVWVLEKGPEDGFATARRASSDPLVQNMVAEGLPLGGLWYSDYLDAR